MAEILLIENPRRGRKSSFVNVYNPKRRINVARKRTRRNPRGLMGMGTMKEWTQGVDAMDAMSAVGGLAASTMIPGAIITDTTSTLNKVLKVGVSLLAAVGAGAAGRSFLTPSAGKAAVIGGLAGTAAQVIAMVTGFEIGNPRAIKSLPLGRGRKIGEAQVVSPSFTREGETVGIITP